MLNNVFRGTGEKNGKKRWTIVDFSTQVQTINTLTAMRTIMVRSLKLAPVKFQNTPQYKECKSQGDTTL